MGSYITVSTKVRKDLLERARRLGINVSELLRRKLEEEVTKKELEEMRRKLDELNSVLEKIDVESIVRSVREDREGDGRKLPV